jgi:drug/metabolite transporter (DMT)-like permease
MKKNMILTFISSFILIFSGGFSWFFVKNHSGFDMPKDFSIFYREFFAACFLLFIAFLMKAKFKLTKEEVKKTLVVSFFYYIVYYFAAYYSTKYIVSGVASCISSTKIFMVPFLLAIVEKKIPQFKVWFISALAVIGTVLISKVNFDIGTVKKSYLFLGILIAFLAPLGNSIANVYLDKNKDKTNINPLVLAGYGNLIGAIFFLAIGIIKHGFIMLPNNKEYLFGLGYLSIVSSGLAIVSLYYLIKQIGSLKATYMSLAHPPVAMVLASFFEGYKLNLTSLTGIFLILLSVYLGLRFKRRSAYEKEGISLLRKHRIQAKRQAKIFWRKVGLSEYIFW